MSSLEARKLHVLNLKEETYKLKSRVTWIKKGVVILNFSIILLITKEILTLFGSLSWRMGRFPLVNKMLLLPTFRHY